MHPPTSTPFLRCPPYASCMAVMLTRLRGGGGRPACYHCTSPRGTRMPSRGVSGRFWGREKNCRGPCGKVWSASEVDASVHRRGWCSARFIFLSSSPLYVVIIVIFLLDCAVQLLWMRLPVGDPLLLRSFWGRKLGQVRVGSSFNASAVSVWLLPPCFQLLSTELQLHLPVFTVLLLLNFASPICSFRTIAKSSP